MGMNDYLISQLEKGLYPYLFIAFCQRQIILKSKFDTQIANSLVETQTEIFGIRVM